MLLGKMCSLRRLETAFAKTEVLVLLRTIRSLNVFLVDGRVFFIGGSVVEWIEGDADLCVYGLIWSCRIRKQVSTNQM